MESTKILSITLNYCTGIFSMKTLVSSAMDDYMKSQELLLCLLCFWCVILVNDQEPRYFFSVNSFQHLTINYQKMAPLPPLSLVMISSVPETKHQLTSISYMFPTFIFRTEAVR